MFINVPINMAPTLICYCAVCIFLILVSALQCAVLMQLTGPIIMLCNLEQLASDVNKFQYYLCTIQN